MMHVGDSVKIMGHHYVHTFQHLQVVEAQRTSEEEAGEVKAPEVGLDLVAQHLPSIFDLEVVPEALRDVMLENLASRNPYVLLLVVVEVVEVL